MAPRVSNEALIQSCIGLTSELLKLSSEHIWIDYDSEADVLYISFRRPQKATRSCELENDVIVRKDGSKVVGITILNASTR